MIAAVLFFIALAVLPLTGGYAVEERCIRGRNKWLCALVPLAAAAGALYGGLRASGTLVYPSDHRIQIFVYDYTYQHTGFTLLFFCVPLLLGAAAALLTARRGERGQRPGRGVEGK